MELIQLISEQTPAVALAITILFFYNRDTARFLQERREMIEALRAERKELIHDYELLAGQYHEQLRASIQAIAAVTAEMHSLKGRIQEAILNEGKRGRNAAGND